MPYSAEQTARLQYDIDTLLPKVFIAADAEDICKQYSDIFRKALGDTNNRTMYDELLTQCNGLELVGKELREEGGTSDPEHKGIYTYKRGSDGYTKFLRAYAGAFRAWDDIIYSPGSNWAGDLIKATKDLISDVGKGAQGLIEGAGESTGKALWGALWPVIAVVGVAIVALVLIAFATKGKVSLG